MEFQIYWNIHDKIYELIIQAVLILATFAWKDIIEYWIMKYYSLDKESINGKIIYAVFLSVLVVILLGTFNSERLSLKSDCIKPKLNKVINSIKNIVTPPNNLLPDNMYMADGVNKTYSDDKDNKKYNSVQSFRDELNKKYFGKKNRYDEQHIYNGVYYQK